MFTLQAFETDIALLNKLLTIWGWGENSNFSKEVKDCMPQMAKIQLLE